MKRRQRLGSLLYTVILSLVLVSILIESAFGLESTKSLRQYVLRTWTTEQGLPQNTIHAMLQTRDGLSWIGTQGGLARFDGASFTLYKTGASDSFLVIRSLASPKTVPEDCGSAAMTVWCFTAMGALRRDTLRCAA